MDTFMGMLSRYSCDSRFISSMMLNIRISNVVIDMLVTLNLTSMLFPFVTLSINLLIDVKDGVSISGLMALPMLVNGVMNGEGSQSFSSSKALSSKRLEFLQS